MNPALAPLLWLLVPLLLVLAPHALHLPLWISLSWLAFAMLRLYHEQTGRHRVGRVLKMLLALAGVAGVLFSYGTVIGPAGGVALLVFLSGAKLLETNTPRDRLGLLFVGCFLLVAHFLDGQSLLAAGYMAFAALALVAGMIATQRPAAAWRPTLALAARLMAQALPLALLVFLLFPRLQGPLWGLPHQAAARSGLSGQMSPGDISQLILSDELAFRAEFSGPQPAPQQLYWRGPVLWDYDGHTWRTATPARAPMPEAVGIGNPVHYSLTLEAQQQRWLPLLGLPAHLPELPGNPTHLGADLQWQAKEPISQRLRYEVEAYPDYLLEASAIRPMNGSFARALALPVDGNLRARELARAWLAGAANDAAIVSQALALFRAQPFFYTLNPPRLGASAVDDFLFTTRRGFCEHYASSFVFLMRAAGVPARVVTGYQGGERNPLGNYLIVRGRDAHAWAEVWLAGRGWVRIDPTAAVAPARVERGITAALPAGEHPGGLVTLEGAWLRPLGLGWDLINNQWNQWVLGYNQARQRQFLSRFNPLLGNWLGMVWALGLGAALLVLAVAVALWPRLAVIRHDPASREYQRFCRALAGCGIPRGAAEAPEDYARRAVALRPDLGNGIKRITRLYLATRYGPEGGDTLRDLHSAVAAFRPARRPAAKLEPSPPT